MVLASVLLRDLLGRLAHLSHNQSRARVVTSSSRYGAFGGRSVALDVEMSHISPHFWSASVRAFVLRGCLVATAAAVLVPSAALAGGPVPANVGIHAARGSAPLVITG